MNTIKAIGFALLLLALSIPAFSAKITDDTLKLGKPGSSANKVLNIGTGAFQYNTSTSHMQFANDGVTFGDITSASIVSMFNVILGSAAQVTAGTATNSTFASYTQVDGDRILILPGYTTSEAWTISHKLYISGLGNTSQVLGAITLNSGASYTRLEKFRTTSNLTISSGVVGVYAAGIWFSGTNTFVDNNSTPASNYLIGMQE